MGTIVLGLRIETHTLRHSCARLANVRHPGQLTEPLARSLLDSDDAHIPGTRAGSFWQFLARCHEHREMLWPNSVLGA